MRSEFYEHLEKIETMHNISGVQSVAVNAYMNSILSTGLVFEKDGTPARGMVLTTVLDWIKNLCLYGFCCFRLLVDEEPGDPNFPVQVPSGRELPVRFSGSKLRWVPDLKKAGTEAPFPTSAADSDEDEDEEENSPFLWHCIVYQPPTETRCTSFAAQSYDDSLRIEELYKVVFLHFFLFFRLFLFSPPCFISLRVVHIHFSKILGPGVFFNGFFFELYFYPTTANFSVYLF